MPKKIDEERDKMTKKDVLTSVNFIDLGAALMKGIFLLLLNLKISFHIDPECMLNWATL